MNFHSADSRPLFVLAMSIPAKLTHPTAFEELFFILNDLVIFIGRYVLFFEREFLFLDRLELPYLTK